MTEKITLNFSRQKSIKIKQMYQASGNVAARTMTLNGVAPPRAIGKLMLEPPVPLDLSHTTNDNPAEPRPVGLGMNRKKSVASNSLAAARLGEPKNNHVCPLSRLNSQRPAPDAPTKATPGANCSRSEAPDRRRLAAIGSGWLFDRSWAARTKAIPG
jgi:hypothetical protein